jgi:hypothetical protein
VYVDERRLATYSGRKCAAGHEKTSNRFRESGHEREPKRDRKIDIGVDRYAALAAGTSD